MSLAQRPTIEAIVSIFETGRLPGPEAYGTAGILDDGAGITYGVHQSTARSGSLHAVLREYHDRGGSWPGMPLEHALAVATNSIGLRPYQISPACAGLIELLRQSGGDLRMQAAQDAVFSRMYWEPAERYAKGIGLVLPLSYLAIYDTWIQSGSSRVDLLRGTFPERPPVRGGAELAWTTALLRARGHWLAQSGNALVRKSVYRVDALLDLAEQGRWMLEPPLTVRGVRVG